LIISTPHDIPNFEKLFETCVRVYKNELGTDKKAIIEPWNYGQFNKLFKWSGPKKEYVLLQNEMIAEDILG